MIYKYFYYIAATIVAYLTTLPSLLGIPLLNTNPDTKVK